MRQPGFSLICRDGSVLLLSDREAHFILLAFHDAARSGAPLGPQATLVHLAFACTSLPICKPGDHVVDKRTAFTLVAGDPHANVPDAAKDGLVRCIVAVLLFAGKSTYRFDMRDGQNLSARDGARMAALRQVILGGAHGSAAVAARTAAVQRLLEHRRRAAHYEGSCIHDVCRAGMQHARAAQVAAQARGRQGVKRARSEDGVDKHAAKQPSV